MIQIKIQPLQTHILLHIYMSSYLEDIDFILLIQTTITQHINANLSGISMLLGDFNIDIALIIRHQSSTWFGPSR
jgi:hypothetical protein